MPTGLDTAPQRRHGASRDVVEPALVTTPKGPQERTQTEQEEFAGSKVFTLSDQLKFAQLSGDYNPMHIDEVAARRTQAGAPVVHGVHAVIWALDSIAQNYPFSTPSNLNVRFAKFMYLNSPIELKLVQRTQTVLKFELTTQGQSAVVATLGLPSKGMASYEPIVGQNVNEILTEGDLPNEPSFEELSGLSGRLVPASYDELHRIFPNVSKAITPQRLSGLAQLSKLVGMISPGLHSIFAGFRVDFVEGTAIIEPYMKFTVTCTDPRFRLVRMDVTGCGLAGNVSAFSRWPPVESPPLTSLTAHVTASEFAGCTALIVGGSRGLGAVTAKILALGGSKLIITYARGKGDACKLADEINTYCGSQCCSTLHVDVRKDVRGQLISLASAVTDFYYFATPPILPQNDGAFSPDLYATFSRFYLSGFFEAVQFLLSQARDGVLSAFYPSSVYVERRPTGLTEYSMVKMAGEILCADLNRFYPRLRIRIERLPRVLTDQTNSVTPTETADPVSIMLPLIRNVHLGRLN
jgi:acyl dehydratase